MRHIVIVPAIIAILAGSSVAAQQPVNLSNFRSVQLRGGGSVDIRPGPRLAVTILEGSSAVTEFTVKHGQLQISACRNRCPANYRLRVMVQSPTAIDSAVSGGGSIDYASGFAPQQSVATAVHGGGTIDVRSLSLRDLTAAVNGRGKIYGGRMNSLTAVVNGGGQITYEGDPAITQAVHGGGSISHSR